MVQTVVEGQTCGHEWGAEDLALTDSGDAVDVCVKCGAPLYVCDDDASED